MTGSHHDNQKNGLYIFLFIFFFFFISLYIFVSLIQELECYHEQRARHVEVGHAGPAAGCEPHGLLHVQRDEAR